jgi:hypothetical protein
MDHDELLNSPQRNHFLVTLRYADQLLVDIEHILQPANSESLFPRYVADFGPEDVEKITTALADFRKQMSSALHSLAIRAAPGEISALHAIATNLDYIDMELENLGPQATRAYGELGAEAAAKLEEAVRSLQSALRPILSYVRQRAGS